MARIVYQIKILETDNTALIEVIRQFNRTLMEDGDEEDFLSFKEHVEELRKGWARAQANLKRVRERDY